LVVDKAGNKMSKRLGNAVDPFETIEKYSADALRWYLITNSQPWDNLKFDLDGIQEVQRKFFGTLYNTYNFFALYANIDGFAFKEPEIAYENRPEIDRWIISALNSLIKTVDEAYDDYEPTKAGREISDFVDAHLSNWYVRLSRRRFWKGEYTQDKISAYQTLYLCLTTLAKLASPIAPFFMDRLFTDLNNITRFEKAESVHLTDFPVAKDELIDKQLEERMELAQSISSMVLSLRKKTNLRVRQPLQKIMIPVSGQEQKTQLERVANLIKSEVNVKEMEYLLDSGGFLVRRIKANFKTLGPRYGRLMKEVAFAISNFDQHEINRIEKEGVYKLTLQGLPVELEIGDVEIITEDIPGWVVANQGNLTVALDITVTPVLYEEGLSRELVNRIQNLRKDKGFEVTDKINISVENSNSVTQAIRNNYDYICSETLAETLDFSSESTLNWDKVELTDQIHISLRISKVN
jgi:isoleucyl-tRNA synthetase